MQKMHLIHKRGNENRLKTILNLGQNDVKKHGLQRISGLQNKDGFKKAFGTL